MRRYVSPIGFSPHLVTRPIIASGVSTGDSVEIIHPEQPSETTENRVTNAIDDVRSTLHGVVSDIDVSVYTLSTADFQTTLDRLSAIVTDDPPPVICLGAGASDLQIPMTIVATAHQDQVVSTMMYSDLDGSATEIDIPPLTRQLPGRAQDTFTLLSEAADSTLTLADIAAALDIDRSTAGRHITALEDRGFVETSIENRSKLSSLTKFGLLIARNQ